MQEIINLAQFTGGGKNMFREIELYIVHKYIPRLYFTSIFVSSLSAIMYTGKNS